MNEYPMMNPVGLSLQAPMGQMSAHEVTPFAQPYIESAIHGEAAAIGKVEEDVKKMRDYRSQAQGERNLGEVRANFERRLKEGLTVAPGSPKSFFLEDGSEDKDKTAAFFTEMQDAYGSVEPSFFSPENEVQWQEDKAGFLQNALNRAKGQIAGQELSSIRQAFDERHALAVAQGDTAGALRNLDNAVQSGIITPTKANTYKLSLARGGLRGRGGSGTPSLTVHGTEYTGLNAALAAQKAKDGGKFDSGDTESAGEDTQVQGASVVPQDVQLGQEDLQLRLSDVVEGETSPADDYLQTGDFGKVLGIIPQTDVDAFNQDVLGVDYTVTPTPRADGSMEFSCTSTAPESVQRAAAHAEQVGELTSADARSMVTSIAMELFAENSGISADTVKKAFKDSGVFEVLGDGDEAVGEARVEGIVKEIQKRAENWTDNLGLDSIKRMVEAHVKGDNFRMDGDREWHDKTWETPFYDSNGEYPLTSGEAEQKRWHKWFDLYTKYRSQFDAKLTGEVTEAEFKKKAGKFYNWYMAHPYKQMREADAKAATDWYMAEITEALMQNVGVGKDGTVTYGSYANDVAVAREVLKRKPPVDLGVDALAARRAEREKEANEKTEALRKRAQSDYQRLREQKAITKENGEKARKAKEKAEKAAEAEAEKRRKKLLNVERSKPRVARWSWDDKNAPDGAEPTCTLPEAEYEALEDKLEWDGTENAYVHIQGVKILVTGSNKSGEIKLNTPAVFKVQGKLKKGAKLRYNGNMQYSYYFK